MHSRFDKRDLKCVVVSASSTVRGLISSVLKELAFKSITTVSDIKSCIEILETEPVSWVISPVRDLNGGHVLHIMSILDKNPSMRALKVSLLRDIDDSCVPQAFEMGAFSAHKFETSKEACFAEFKGLMDRLEQFQGDCTLVAAHYLSEYLMEKGEYQELKGFYQALLQIFPGRADILLNLARVMFLNQDTEEAKVLVQQMLLTAPEKKTELEGLRKAFIPYDTGTSDDMPAIAGHFGFRTCLILDSDKACLDRMENLILKAGFTTVVPFQDPVQLLKWIRYNPAPDLVLSEWQLPNLPGPIFLYKIRRRLELEIPLIIINRQITERDNTWIRELGVSCLVAKPIVEADLFQAVVWTMKQSKGPSDLISLKNKLKVLSKSQHKDLHRYRQEYMQHSMLIESDRLLMEAQLALDAGCFLHAKKYALDALKAAGDSREALEILGKSLMKLREFDGALRCLENGQFYSPYNVGFLCDIAECHLENGDETNFEKYLDEAKTLDPDAQVVIETEAKGAMKKGHTEMAKKLLGSLKSFKEVLAFMNNRAVALIQVGKHAEGLELYQKALASIPDGQPEVRSLLSYNLGLGFARSQRLVEAQEALEAAALTKNPLRQKKANSLRARVGKAIEMGETVTFPGDKVASIDDESARLQLLRDISESENSDFKISRSDYCVNKIYKSRQDSSKAQEVLLVVPVFTPRGKLVKDYLHGMTQIPLDTTVIK